MLRLQTQPTQIVQNIWKPEQQKIECLCPKDPSSQEQNKRLSQCYRCLQQFHSDCFWAPEKGEQYQCPFCYIRHCLPQKSVKNIVFMGYLPIPKKQRIQHRVNFTIGPQMKTAKNIHFQARCLKFDEKNRYEISWPDNGSFTIGKMKVNEFRPLLVTSPLKRRADEPIRLDKGRLQINNEIIIQEKIVSQTGYKKSNKSFYLVAIMAVQELSMELVVANFQNKFIPVNQSKEALKQSMTSSGEIVIQKISVSLKCQYFGGPMKLPAKSRLCKTKHMQPFDLTSFIVSSISAKTSTRRWKCPICDRRAYDLVIDKYILDLMDPNKVTNEIRFKVNGEPDMIEGKDDSESQDSNLIVKPQKNEKLETVIDLDCQSVEPVPVISKQILSSSEPVCISDDDQCEPQPDVRQKLKALRQNIKQVIESVLNKKRKIDDGATRVVSVPVQRLNMPIELSDSEDSEENHVGNSKVSQTKTEFRTKPERKEGQLLDGKLDKVQSCFHKKAVQVPQFNPIINANYQNFKNSILNVQAKGAHFKPLTVEENKLASVILVDSDHQQSTQEETVHTTKSILHRQKKDILDEDKVDANESIFKWSYQNMVSKSQSL